MSLSVCLCLHCIDPLPLCLSYPPGSAAVSHHGSPPAPLSWDSPSGSSPARRRPLPPRSFAVPPDSHLVRGWGDLPAGTLPRGVYAGRMPGRCRWRRRRGKHTGVDAGSGTSSGLHGGVLHTNVPSPLPTLRTCRSGVRNINVLSPPQPSPAVAVGSEHRGAFLHRGELFRLQMEPRLACFSLFPLYGKPPYRQSASPGVAVSAWVCARSSYSAERICSL